MGAAGIRPSPRSPVLGFDPTAGFVDYIVLVATDPARKYHRPTGSFPKASR